MSWEQEVDGLIRHEKGRKMQTIWPNDFHAFSNDVVAEVTEEWQRRDLDKSPITSRKTRTQILQLADQAIVHQVEKRLASKRRIKRPKYKGKPVGPALHARFLGLLFDHVSSADPPPRPGSSPSRAQWSKHSPYLTLLTYVRGLVDKDIIDAWPALSLSNIRTIRSRFVKKLLRQIEAELGSMQFASMERSP